MTNEEKGFRGLFAINFLAAVAANRYSEAAHRGDPRVLAPLPVEDAFRIARATWRAFGEAMEGDDEDQPFD